MVWRCMSAPKGRDVEDMESDEGGMARDYYGGGALDFMEIVTSL